MQEDMHCIKICRGYSRDHRPELNQAILLMMTENQAGIPVFMAASSGNVNDNKNFKKVISKHLKSYREALNNHYLIGDAALYTTDNVQMLQQQEQQFITRVPSKIKEAKELIDSVAFCAMTPVEGAEGYECYEVLSDHADVPPPAMDFGPQRSGSKERTENTAEKDVKEDREGSGSTDQ